MRLHAGTIMASLKHEENFKALKASAHFQLDFGQNGVQASILKRRGDLLQQSCIDIITHKQLYDKQQQQVMFGGDIQQGEPQSCEKFSVNIHAWLMTCWIGL